MEYTNGHAAIVSISIQWASQADGIHKWPSCQISILFQWFSDHWHTIWQFCQNFYSNPMTFRSLAYPLAILPNFYSNPMTFRSLAYPLVILPNFYSNAMTLRSLAYPLTILLLQAISSWILSIGTYYEYIIFISYRHTSLWHLIANRLIQYLLVYYWF